jgi:beta-lactamase class A
MNLNPLKCSLSVTAIIISCIFLYIPALASAQQVKPTSIEKKLAELETSFDGRIGIYAIQSTFKVMAVSAILKRSMADNRLLQEKVTYTKQDLVFWSPITEKHLADGMTISELCSAAMMYSDNTATNLIVKKLGGPSAVTAFARSIGDNTFRIDSWEPELNSNPNDLRDTSTPTAMEKSLQKLTLGNVLASPQRKQLVTWMKGNTTGDARIRAGVPKGWLVADKTGTGSDYGISNDIGIIWPSNDAPVVVSIYSINNKKDAARRDDVIAQATRILVDEFRR